MFRERKSTSPYVEEKDCLSGFHYFANQKVPEKRIADKFVCKLHVNLSEESFKRDRSKIIKAIGEAAVEAKLDDRIPFFKMIWKYNATDYVNDKMAAEFLRQIKLSSIDEVPNTLTVLKAQEQYSKVYRIYIAKFLELYKKINSHPHCRGPFRKYAALRQFADQEFNQVRHNMAAKLRFINRAQHTIYVTEEKATVEETSEQICRFVVILEKKFKKLRLISSETINDTDSPVSEFISFRIDKLNGKSVDRFQQDTTFFITFKPRELQELKKSQDTCDVYVKLVEKCKAQGVYRSKPIHKMIGTFAEEYDQWEREEERRSLHEGMKLRGR